MHSCLSPFVTILFFLTFLHLGHVLQLKMGQSVAAPLIYHVNYANFEMADSLDLKYLC